MANATPYADKIKAVQTWLTESGWTVFDSAFDYNDLTGRAMQEFGYAHKDRARILVDKAARLLRGEYVQTHGGAPRGNTNRANGTKRRVSVPVDELTPKQREKYLKRDTNMNNNKFFCTINGENVDVYGEKFNETVAHYIATDPKLFPNETRDSASALAGQITSRYVSTDADGQSQTYEFQHGKGNDKQKFTVRLHTVNDVTMDKLPR